MTVCEKLYGGVLSGSTSALQKILNAANINNASMPRTCSTFSSRKSVSMEASRRRYGMRSAANGKAGSRLHSGSAITSISTAAQKYTLRQPARSSARPNRPFLYGSVEVKSRSQYNALSSSHTWPNSTAMKLFVKS